MAPTCDFCGTTAPETPESTGEPVAGPPPPVPLTWTTAVENGRQRLFCDRCSREHLRSIESKLDSEWW